MGLVEKTQTNLVCWHQSHAVERIR